LGGSGGGGIRAPPRPARHGDEPPPATTRPARSAMGGRWRAGPRPDRQQLGFGAGGRCVRDRGSSGGRGDRFRSGPGGGGRLDRGPLARRGRRAGGVSRTRARPLPGGLLGPLWTRGGARWVARNAPRVGGRRGRGAAVRVGGRLRVFPGAEWRACGLGGGVVYWSRWTEEETDPKVREDP
jgi:hypothetical protein